MKKKENKINEQINRINEIIFINEQSLEDCEEILKNADYKVYSPTERKEDCDNREDVKCVTSKVDALGFDMSTQVSVDSFNSKTNCYVLLKSVGKTSGYPTYHISFYTSKNEFVLSMRLPNGKKKIVYGGTFDCGVSTIVIGKIKYRGEYKGSGLLPNSSDVVLDSSSNPIMVDTAESLSYGIPEGELTQKGYFNYMVKSKVATFKLSDLKSKLMD